MARAFVSWRHGVAAFSPPQVTVEDRLVATDATPSRHQAYACPGTA